MTRIPFALLVSVTLTGSAHAQVDVLRTPNRGIQPQAIMDANGTLHLLYFDRDPKAGNLMYVRRDAGKTDFSAPIRVNSQEGSAIAVGSIRGGQLALGKNGRVHVAWNGSGKAEPKNPISGAPMMYARLNDKGDAFEEQINLMTHSYILDGGGALTADTQGNVFVAWHALGKDDDRGEHNRKVWVAISKNEGKTFAAEKPAWSEPTGACGCCGMRGFTDRKGNAFFLYRGAGAKINRGMYALKSTDQGKSFAGQQLDNWRIETCPMSSEGFAEGPRGVYAAWDNEGQIFFSLTQSPLAANVPVIAAPGNSGNRRHPALAFNKKDEMILVWTEGTGWMRGGSLHWQVYDKNFTPTDAGRRPGAIPVWGLPAVVAEADGRFTILH